MNNTAYAGHGVEIEEDIVRLRRRKLEFEGDVARGAGWAQPRPRRLSALLRTRARLATPAPRGSGMA